MAVRYFALIYGIVFILVGVAGFIPPLVTPPEPAQPDLVVDPAHGNLLGLFPVNVLHNLVHIGFGAWGIAAYPMVRASIIYARSVAIIYLVFAVMGFIPVLNVAFGLVPLHGHVIWLHLLLAAGAAYFGFIAPRPEPMAPARHR